MILLSCFAGAVGEAHGMECNMKAALKTKEYGNIKWVIVGDGRKLEWVRSFVKEHDLDDTVITLGRFPSETMPLFFERANVSLCLCLIHHYLICILLLK